MSATLQTRARRRRRSTGDTRSLPGSDHKVIGEIEHALDVLHGKWKVQLLFLMARGVHRHCKLLECLRGASKKMMTDTLRALERDGLVNRRIYAEVPLRVEYSLTPLGWAITEPLVALAEWDETYGAEVEEARIRYRMGEGKGSAPEGTARRRLALKSAAR